MGRYALALSLLALACALVPGGMYWGMGLGGFAATCGWLGYRRRDDSGWVRLAGAMGMTVALFAVLLAGGRFVLTFWAVGRLTDMLVLY